jgi:hypothetical protein
VRTDHSAEVDRATPEVIEAVGGRARRDTWFGVQINKHTQIFRDVEN